MWSHDFECIVMLSFWQTPFGTACGTLSWRTCPSVAPRPIRTWQSPAAPQQVRDGLLDKRCARIRCRSSSRVTASSGATARWGITAAAAGTSQSSGCCVTKAWPWSDVIGGNACQMPSVALHCAPLSVVYFISNRVIFIICLFSEISACTVFRAR